jgi:transcriptional regulator with XRE-family HTH domain
MTNTQSAPFAAFGRALAAARVAAGINNQVELAAQVGCSQQSVSRWEAGVGRPRVGQMTALASAVGKDVEDLLALAGYAPKGPEAATNAKLFPVDNLDPDTFERFVTYMLELLYPDADVQRAGSSGHTQDGLDITVVWSDRRYSYQCKRVERFGPADVLKAIDAHTAPADKKHLVLSRIASPQAVEAARSRPDWVLWDKEKLSAIIRLKLSIEDQERLVDIFFRGQRLALLGRDEVGPWQTADAYFAPWSHPAAALSHDWGLEGREVEMAKLTEMIIRPTSPVVLVTGPGGIGKSRLLKAALAQPAIATQHMVRFLSASAEITRDGLDRLGSQRKLLVVDDAHDRDGLSGLFEYAADPAHNTQILLSTRPYAVSRLKREAAVYGIGAFPQVLLERLSEAETVALVTEVLTTFGGDPNWAPEIVRATRDCPLVAVMAARIVARDGLSNEMVKNDEALRQTILGKFTKVVAGELGTAADQLQIPGALDVLALVQPFHVEDPQLIELLGATKAMAPADVARILRLLLDGGVIYRRGHQYRLMPDLLGDYIIEQSCIGPGHTLSPFAEQVFDLATGGQVTNVLVNLGRLDWRRSAGDPSGSRFLDTVWRKLDDVDDDYDPRMSAVQSVAVYQPKQALAFIQTQFDKGRVPRGVAGIVRNIAYNLEYLEEACALLWELGRDDERPTGPHPDHPIRVLTELCSFQERKPLIFTERVFEFGLALFDDESAWNYAYSPLDVVGAVLSGEGISTTSKGRHIQMSTFFIDFDVVAPLRQRLIERILSLLTSPNLTVAHRAAKFLDNALRAPMGLMGAAVRPDVRDRYLAEFEQTLNRLAALVTSARLYPAVMIAVARSVAWHAQYGSGRTAGAARAVMDALPTDLEFRTRAALADGWGQVFMGRSRPNRWEGDLEAWMAALGRELRTTHTDPEALRRHLEGALADLAPAGEGEGSAQVLIVGLLRENLPLARAIVADARGRPDSLTRHYVGQALHELLCVAPDEGREVARALLVSPRLGLAVYAAAALGGLRRDIEDEDVEILKIALASFEPEIARVAVRTLWSWSSVDTRTLIDLARLAHIEAIPGLADGLGMLFGGPDRRLLEALDRDDVLFFLNALRETPTLDGYWLEQLIVDVSARFPHDLAEFFFARVERAATAETFGSFRPANHGPYANAQLKINESPEAAAVLQKTWAWLRENEGRDLYFQYAAADVFNAMFMSVDQAMVDLFEAKLETASKAELNLMSRLLSKAHHDFIFAHIPFVVRFLERCRDVSEETATRAFQALFGSAISGIRSGVLGQPAPQDLRMVESAQAVLKTISRLSPAWRLYDRVRKSGEDDIARTIAHGEALDDE